MTSCADCQPDIVTAFVQTTSRGIAAWVVQIVSLGRLTGGFIRADPCGPHSWARSADYQPRRLCRFSAARFGHLTRQMQLESLKIPRASCQPVLSRLPAQRPKYTGVCQPIRFALYCKIRGLRDGFPSRLSAYLLTTPKKPLLELG
jgi:hypothetical protein